MQGEVGKEHADEREIGARDVARSRPRPVRRRAPPHDPDLRARQVPPRRGRDRVPGRGSRSPPGPRRVRRGSRGSRRGRRARSGTARPTARTPAGARARARPSPARGRRRARVNARPDHPQRAEHQNCRRPWTTVSNRPSDEVRVLGPREDEPGDRGGRDHHERVLGRALPGLRTITAAQQREHDVRQQLQHVRPPRSTDARRACGSGCGEGRRSARDPGDDGRDHREQREGGQDAAHEREAEPDRARSGPGPRPGDGDRRATPRRDGRARARRASRGARSCASVSARPRASGLRRPISRSASSNDCPIAHARTTASSSRATSGGDHRAPSSTARYGVCPAPTPTPTRSTATATWRAISSSSRRRRRDRPGARSTRPSVRTGGNRRGPRRRAVRDRGGTGSRRRGAASARAAAPRCDRRCTSDDERQARRRRPTPRRGTRSRPAPAAHDAAHPPTADALRARCPIDADRRARTSFR